MLHEAALCILLMSNAAFSDASFPNLRYNSAVERDNGIAITHTKTQQTKMKVDVNVALTVSVCGHLPMVKCPSGVSGPICHEILSWLSVICRRKLENLEFEILTVPPVLRWLTVTVRPVTDRESNQGGAEAARSNRRRQTPTNTQCRYTMQVPERVA